MERISIESEQDKAIGTLGETLGTCWFRISAGICNDTMCAACPTKHKLDSCYEYLDDFNKLAVENEAMKYSAKMILQHGGIKECKKQAKFGETGSSILTLLFIWFKGMILLATVLLVPYLLFACSSPRYIIGLDCMRVPYNKQQVRDCKEMNEQNIAYIIGKSRERLRDVNGDGMVNCIDYSVAFKETWDRIYYTRMDRCNFVINKNPVTGFHHMFIRVTPTYYPWEDILVEPQASPGIYDKDKSRLYVNVYWGDRYDGRYNKYEFSEQRYSLDLCEWESKQEYYMHKGVMTR